jgi:hypothetical protein
MSVPPFLPKSTLEEKFIKTTMFLGERTLE